MYRSRRFDRKVSFAKNGILVADLQRSARFLLMNSVRQRRKRESLCGFFIVRTQ